MSEENRKIKNWLTGNYEFSNYIKDSNGQKTPHKKGTPVKYGNSLFVHPARRGIFDGDDGTRMKDILNMFIEKKHITKSSMEFLKIKYKNVMRRIG